MHPIRFLRRPDVRRHPLRFASRRIRFEVARRLSPSSLAKERVTQIDGGVKMSLRLDDLIEETIWLFGLHEFATANVFMRLINPGMTVVDAGAHAGQFTLLAARAAGPSGRVLAFEPHEPVRARLERNVALNGFGNVTVSALALSDRDGEATLEMPSWAGANTGVASLRSQGGGPATTVHTGRLDKAIGSFPPDVIKIDVEGLEAQVVAGATATIRRSHPAIVFESNDARPTQFLRAEGYVVHGIQFGGGRFSLIPIGERDDPARFREPWQALNLVALHPATKTGHDLVS